MPNDSTLAALLHDAGPLLEDADIYDYPDAAAHQIVFDDDFDIILKGDADREVVVLEGDLGKPPEGSEPQLYPMLLSLGRIWETTGGLQFSVDPNDGEVVLHWDLGAANLDAQKLHAALLSFAERMVIWREVVASGGVEDDDRSIQPSSESGGEIIVG